MRLRKWVSCLATLPVICAWAFEWSEPLDNAREGSTIHVARRLDDPMGSLLPRVCGLGWGEFPNFSRRTTGPPVVLLTTKLWVAASTFGQFESPLVGCVRFTVQFFTTPSHSSQGRQPPPPSPKGVV